MATVMNNLYPPIMPNVIPAFVRTSPCKIYFAISDYNAINDIANVQISLVNVKTNASALNTQTYPSGIKITNLMYDSQVHDDYCYYVVIKPQDMIGGNFILNQYYKIQLRFTSTDAEYTSPSGVQRISKWLSDNKMYFSEWSRVSLIRGISKPTLDMDHLTEDGSVNVLAVPIIKLTGQLNFQSTEETDYLNEYDIKVFWGNRPFSDPPIYDSGVISADPQKKNKIECIPSCTFQQNTFYIINVNYTTKYLYHDSVYYYIQMNITQNNEYHITITPSVNEDDGYINLDIDMDNRQDFISTDKQIMLRRSSSKDGFKTWQVLYTSIYPFVKLRWQDIAIESGIWYKYSVIIFDSETTQNPVLYSPIESEPVMCVFEDIFLVGDNNIQLRLKFNPTVTSFKYNVSESQQVTIGSKFPFIKRSGKNYYRTFSLNGLISSLIDETEWFDSYIPLPDQDPAPPHMRFTTKRDVYGGDSQIQSMYDEYSYENRIPNYLNPYYERLFRELIFDFLYSSNARLFRSPTEGNILVKLTNISFEPQTSLGRVLYAFTATAVEIDEPTFENCKKYGVFPREMYEIVTESPVFNIERNSNLDMTIVINADGATQRILDPNNSEYILHLERHRVRGRKLV